MLKRYLGTCAFVAVVVLGLASGAHATQAEPVATEPPPPAQEPMVAEEPVAAEEPMVAEEPATAEEPMAAEEPATAEEPMVLMDGAWAHQACEAWNQSEELTAGLAKWAQNHKDRGYKIIQLHRSDCADSTWAELRIEPVEGGADCAFGGELQTAELDHGADYVMNATTERWQEMGAGRYGPMRAMLTGRLKFKGPMFEAMRNMGPFQSFLLLVGEVPGDVASCP